MKQTYTINDLLRILYKEVPVEDALSVTTRLAENYMLKEAFTELLDAKSALPKVGFLPSKDTLNSILKYSESTLMEATC